MPIEPKEDIVKAVCTDKYDGERVSPSLLTGENNSVSRLAIIPLKEHWDLFRQHVQRPPQRRLKLIAEINVGRLQEIGHEQQPPVALTVEPKPEEWNPAHAEIPQRITRGLANKILPELKLHQPPESEKQ
ncbi:MAG TPA: hypothetical protein VN765_07255 [Candidatus Acidoferrum sp.]|nr:hypothetical protein [Candidatus Acidoferrum sp.]